MQDNAETEADENGCEICGHDVEVILSWGGNIRPRKEKLCGRHAEERRKGLLQIGEQVSVTMQHNDVAWFSDESTGYPGDQTYDDVPSNDPAVSYWATIGPEDEAAGTWSWTINATNDACDQWEEDGGIVTSEAEAKAAVEAWQPPQHGTVQ